LAIDWLPARDDDDLPDWTDEQLDRAQFSIGGNVIRQVTGTLTKAGRSAQSAVAKRQLTLRIDPDVIARFREGGPGWQGRMNAALRKAVGL
jgi:uncharacterized protein (DUF4415 family)